MCFLRTGEREREREIEIDIERGRERVREKVGKENTIIKHSNITTSSN